jgi:hypothetical protein
MKLLGIVAAVAVASTTGCASRCCPPVCYPPAGTVQRFATPAPIAPARVVSGPAATPPAAPAPAAPAATPAPGAPMDMEKAFAEMMKLAEPVAEHAGLATWVGEWNLKGKFTMGDKVTESDGTSSITSILGGRFIRQEAHGSMDGMPFEGRGVIGYDTFKKKFVGVWIDSMGTGIMSSVGEETEKGKVWTFTGSYDTPMGMMTTRDVMRRVSENELVYQSDMSIGGNPSGSMTLTYKRK